MPTRDGIGRRPRAPGLERTMAPKDERLSPWPGSNKARPGSGSLGPAARRAPPGTESLSASEATSSNHCSGESQRLNLNEGQVDDSGAPLQTGPEEPIHRLRAGISGRIPGRTEAVVPFTISVELHGPAPRIGVQSGRALHLVVPETFQQSSPVRLEPAAAPKGRVRSRPNPPVTTCYADRLSRPAPRPESFRLRRARPQNRTGPPESP